MTGIGLEGVQGWWRQVWEGGDRLVNDSCPVRPIKVSFDEVWVTSFPLQTQVPPTKRAKGGFVLGDGGRGEAGSRGRVGREERSERVLSFFWLKK